MTPVERLLTQLTDAKRTAKGWVCRCPAHEDRRASLSIGEGVDGRALVHCQAECKVGTVCDALGLTVLDLMPTASSLPTPPGRKAHRKPTAEGGCDDQAR